MDKNNNPFSGFDWRSFEKSFGGSFPKEAKLTNDNSTWVEQYVRHILRQSIPALDQTEWETPYNTEITETHHTIILKISIPDRTEAKNIRIFAASTQVKLEGNGKEHFQLIRLPHPVVPANCKAVYKDGIMQLHIRKQDKDEPFYEIDVRYS
ncbi:MAG: hypothetical protein K0S39_5456 [Paenibacillus sp.]|jgi:HSP20 family molecular chaperone IbpA|nr:hypothetical protein [Paenibacillus sp.]